MTTKPLNTVPPSGRIIAINEQVTRPPAAEAIRQSRLSQDGEADIEILDNATGGGVLVAELLKLAQEKQMTRQIKRIITADINDTMLDYARVRQAREKWDQTGIRIDVLKVDQENPDLPDTSFNYIFSNFGVFFSKDDSRTLSETYRLLKPNGKAVFTSWKEITWWTGIVMPAFKRHLPEAPLLPDSNTLFPSKWNTPEAIDAKLKAAGFSDVQVNPYEFDLEAEPEDFTEAAAVLVNSITKKVWSEQEAAKYGPQIQAAMLKFLREEYPGGRWSGKLSALVSSGEKIV